MTSRPVIAIVDDDHLARKGTGSLMRSLGYSIETFSSAEDFLKSDASVFACVISDVQMAGLSGLDLQRLLRERVPGLSVIFLTAFPDERVKAQALSGGAAVFLEKPCDPDVLIDYVKSSIDSARH